MISVVRCSSKVVRPTIEMFHYLHKWPHPKSLPFAMCLNIDGETLAPDGRPFGILVWKKLQHHRQKGLFGYEDQPTSWQVLDLGRVWVHPDLQGLSWEGKNRRGEVVIHRPCYFSKMVALGIRRIQTDWLEHHPPRFPELPYHIELIVSYCDRAHHQGIGYRAAGFEHFGETEDKTKDIYFRRLKKPNRRWNDPQWRFELEVA